MPCAISRTSTTNIDHTRASPTPARCIYCPRPIIDPDQIAHLNIRRPTTRRHPPRVRTCRLKCADGVFSKRRVSRSTWTGRSWRGRDDVVGGVLQREQIAAVLPLVEVGDGDERLDRAVARARAVPG